MHNQITLIATKLRNFTMIKILPSTYVANEVVVQGSFWTGTAQVDIDGKIVTTKAHRNEKYGWIYVAGFVGHYATGTKMWKAMVQYSAESDVTSAWFGRDERSGRCTKQNGVRFDLALYESL